MIARRLVLAVVLAAGLPQAARAEWSWWPRGKNDSPVARRAQPSTWDKLSMGTKQMWSKTKDAVTPGRATPHRTASMITRKAPSQRSRKANKGWINSWFGSREKEGPQTVNEFLKQPRPEF